MRLPVMARPVKLFYSCVLCIAGPSPRWQRMCLCSLLSGNFPQIQRYFCPSFLKSNSLSHLIMLDSSDHTIIILCVHMLLPIPFLFSLKTSPIRISSSPFQTQIVLVKLNHNLSLTNLSVVEIDISKAHM